MSNTNGQDTQKGCHSLHSMAEDSPKLHSEKY